MTIDWEAYGRSLNIQPAGGEAECVHMYPPPCEMDGAPEACAMYGCDRRGGVAPWKSLQQCRAEYRVRLANEAAQRAAAALQVV
jgi:hypothetical protein